ncbi:MAG: hypothetical protein ACI9YH_002959, partial [Colwellia sp.]
MLFLQIKLTINSFKESAMKTFKNTLSILTLLVSGICTANEQDHQSTITTQPNFIVILTDDQGYADVGFNGSKDIRTPNIDRIANEGTKFTNGYVSYAV